MAETRSALITGITGQDGSYLAELLLEKGYDVFGLAPLDDSFGVYNIEHILDRVSLIDGDLRSDASIEDAFARARPDEVYNLAALSSIPMSFEQPELTFDLNARAVERLLETIRTSFLSTRFFQAASMEVFGEVTVAPQNESTEFRPRNPYGESKAYAFNTVVRYRERCGIHASNGILYNHESPRRGLNFVTRKITDGVARIHLGLQDKLYLGNLDASRDWGYAPDYVRMEWMMTQAEEPDDYVVATGVSHSIREFLDHAFARVGIEDWDHHVEVKEEFYRPAEAVELRGDPTKARARLGWEPKVTFEELVALMVDSDLALLSEPP
jgi:GDPmannose 4,6-dehydratase